MRHDQAYKPKPESPQLQLPGLGAEGEQDAAAAYEWIAANPSAWDYMVSNAYRLSRTGYVSIRYLMGMVRNELRIGVANPLSAAFGRIMAKEHPRLEASIKRHGSRCDGYVETTSKGSNHGTRKAT